MIRARREGALLLLAALLMGSVAVPAGARTARVRGETRPQGFVRVNQVGYERTGSKRAYLLSPRPAEGATFALIGSGGAVRFSGPVGADLGPWSDAFPHVYALDFDALTRRGTYTIRAGGAVRAVSPPFRIDAGRRLATRPLRNALFFYQAERDGPAYVHSGLRTAPAHLNDRAAMTYRTPQTNGDGVFHGVLQPLGRRIDASGGWWDAGDYPKFVETTSYVVDMLLVGVRDFPPWMGAGATGSNFTDEAAFGLRWLLKMWDDRARTLYYQVGIGSGNSTFAGDHDIWRLPHSDDTYGGSDPQFRYIRHRPVFRAAPAGARVSPNIAGRDAAAFALGYQVFRTTRPGLAARALRAAEHIFDLADTSPEGRLLTVIPFGFYPETAWRDDLEFGSTELATALAMRGTRPGLPHTHPAFYVRQAARWARAFIDTPGDGDVLNMYDVSGLAHAELFRAIRKAGNPTRDPFGFGVRWGQWDTATHGAGMAVEASTYDQLTGTARYADEGRRWLGNILGANAWGSSFIVGDGTRFPQCMQHQVANISGSLDGSRPLLRGALVEGPNSYAAHGRLHEMRSCPANGVDSFARFDRPYTVFADNVESYDTVEPAIDLTAASPLAFARLAAGLV